jgi:hypothetical protein
MVIQDSLKKKPKLVLGNLESEKNPVLFFKD